jgi:hypothetical protein
VHYLTAFHMKSFGAPSNISQITSFYKLKFKFRTKNKLRLNTVNFVMFSCCLLIIRDIYVNTVNTVFMEYNNLVFFLLNVNLDFKVTFVLKHILVGSFMQ